MYISIVCITEKYRITDSCVATAQYVFTALHGMQTRSGDENSVCPSVKRVHCDKTEGLSRFFLYHMKDHLTYFSEKTNGWWGRPLLPEILGQPAPVEAIADLFVVFCDRSVDQPQTL